jgi:2-octaprenyl-6-methoxyphenol hydroxylase
MPQELHDIVIAGSGPVGTVLAHALAPLAQESRLDIVQVGNNNNAAGDDRPIALSWGSRLILGNLGLWEALPRTPITSIHVSQQQGFGRTLISAADHNIEALGYVVSYRDLLSGLANPVPLRAGRVLQWQAQADGVLVQCDTGELRTRLLVLAEGGAASPEDREKVKAYGQSAIVCELETERPHGNRAWERFATEGPLALLPFRGQCALVWTSRSDTAARLMALDDASFLKSAEAAFGRRLGNFLRSGPRAAFPLSLRYRRETARAGIIAIGNSAQTLHPVAGQGLNLGLRDAWELAELITDAVDTQLSHAAEGERAGKELGGDEFARRYALRRRGDRMALVGLTDGLVQAFGMQMPLASTMRGAALAFLDAVPPARRFLSRRMMFGARGLP